MSSSQVIENKNKKPILDLHVSDDCSDKFSFWINMKNARLILEHVEDIENYVEEYGDQEEEATAKAKPKVLSRNGEKVKPKKAKPKSKTKRLSRDDD